MDNEEVEEQVQTSYVSLFFSSLWNGISSFRTLLRYSSMNAIVLEKRFFLLSLLSSMLES